MPDIRHPEPASPPHFRLYGESESSIISRRRSARRAELKPPRTAFGLDRLVWGSDWPHTLFEVAVSYAPQRQLLELWFPKAADRQVVLLETPARLFSFIDAQA